MDNTLGTALVVTSIAAMCMFIGFLFIDYMDTDYENFPEHCKNVTRLSDCGRQRDPCDLPFAPIMFSDC